MIYFYFIRKGTTFIIGPVAQIVKLHKLLGATPNKYGGFSFDCNQVQNLPSLTFTVSGNPLVLNGADYVWNVN